VKVNLARRGRSDALTLLQRPGLLVAKAVVPDYALSSHVAPLGLAFYAAHSLPQKYHGGAFVGEHGSWDRQQFNGYKVVFVPFSGGHPNGNAEDVVTGFLNANGEARGRPVGVAVDKTGALLIADDVGERSLASDICKAIAPSPRCRTSNMMPTRERPQADDRGRIQSSTWVPSSTTRLGGIWK
jgi:hypothetical protein